MGEARKVVSLTSLARFHTVSESRATCARKAAVSTAASRRTAQGFSTDCNVAVPTTLVIASQAGAVLQAPIHPPKEGIDYALSQPLLEFR